MRIILPEHIADITLEQFQKYSTLQALWKDYQMLTSYTYEDGKPKVDSPEDILSLAPTRVYNLSMSPIEAFVTGTKDPIWVIKQITAVCLKIADFPDMFGPVIMRICCVS